tara:strand:- start:1751 stop:2215 length:465 start_codon:yes stop_codon:yes gene_type:complete
MAYQVCMTDEYGSTSIMLSKEKLEDAIEHTHQEIHKENMENALTSLEQLRSWEYFAVVFFDQDSPSDKFVYSGKDSKGNHCVFNVEDAKTLLPLDNAEGEIRVYIGQQRTGERDADTKKEITRPLYAEDERGQVVTDLSHRLASGKSVLFVRKA